MTVEVFKSHATYKDWQNMIKTLPNDLGKFFLFNEDSYCPVGWMGHCMGVNDNWMQPNSPGRIYNDIMHYYGITGDELRDIWYSNDINVSRDETIKLMRKYATRSK